MTPAEPKTFFDFLTAAGEVGERMRSFDWTHTSLGPIEEWPASLKTSVSLMLGSRHPMWIGWGAQMSFLYNDAYLHVLGPAKHPWALGRPACEVWAEIWDICGPLADKVFLSGEASFVEDVRLFMNRGDFLEETFYSFSYSPIRDETGQVAGLFCPSADVTPKVIGARRLRTLAELSANALVERTIASACTSVARTLSKNPVDIPFALLYLTDEGGRYASLEQTIGQILSDPLRPKSVLLTETSESPLWQIAAAFSTAQRQTITIEHPDSIPGGELGQRVTRAVALPLTSHGAESPFGVLVAGVNPCRDLDRDHYTFFDLIANQVATAIQNARATEEDRKRAEMLAELDRAKTVFFSNVSHEFRTPLTLMLGPLEDVLAKPEHLSNQDRERLEVAHRNSLRLLKLVNTLLDFSRIEAGQVQARFEPVDLGAFTAEIANNFRSACERAGLDFIIDCPPLPAPVYIDREMWQKIVLNLVSNALKFTFHGSIRVELSALEGVVELAVRDTGTGIPEAELPRLFNRFHRVEGSKGRTHEGTGIGLALVQELVRAHGGTVSVESALGSGSRFTVQIPFGRHHLTAGRISDSPPSGKDTGHAEAYVQEALRWLPDETGDRRLPQTEPDEFGSRLFVDPAVAGKPRARVLLAEDNADMRDYVRRLLSPYMDLTAVSNGQEALESVRTNPPDLILSDIMMPILDGVALLKQLRADPKTATLPVILLSARAGEESRVEGVTAGADDYLVKPFTARELIARVAAHLRMARLRNSALDELRRVNEDLNQFAYSASHDLQEPLRNIAIYSQLLRRKLGDQADEEIAGFLRFIIEGASRMANLLRDLLAYTRVTSESIASEPADSNVILHQVLEDLRLATEEAGAGIDAGDMPILPVNGLHLHQLFQNLVGNALKYRDSSRPPIIQIRSFRQGSWWRFSVHDNGIGIAPEYRQQIFGIFKRLHSTAEYSGTGMGLAIAQRIVERYDGRIWVDSELGKGTTFFFTLPA